METINWVLIGVIIIIGGCGWKEKNAGFIKAAFSMLSIILAITGAMLLGPIVEVFIPVNQIFAYILAFIISSVALAVVCNVLDIAAKLPVLHEINQTAGLLVGLVEGLLDVWIAFIVLDLFAETEWGTVLLNMVHSSELVSIFYENNLLYKIWNIL